MYTPKSKLPFLISLFILSISILFNSCKEREEFVGPAICPSSTFATTFSSFATLPLSVNLSTTTLNLKATFTEAISWTVTIKGENGAQRSYSDNSKEVDIAWRGESGNTTFFKDGPVTIEFKIACRDAIGYTVNISANDFSSYSASGKGVLISDFDGNGIVSNAYKILPDKGYVSGGWGSYYTIPQNELTEFAIHNGTLSHKNSSDQYFTLKGQAGPGNWSCGGGYTDLNLSAISTSADKTYFNALLNRGNNENTILAIALKSNGINYIKMVPLNWTDWKMVSFKFSEFEDANGLYLTDVANITALDLNLNGATAPAQNTEANLDFIIITAGEPFLGN